MKENEKETGVVESSEKGIFEQLLKVQELNKKEKEVTEVYCGKNTKSHGH